MTGNLEDLRSFALGAPVIKQVRQLYSPGASDMHFVRDIAFGSDMRCARLKLQYECFALKR